MKTMKSKITLAAATLLSLTAFASAKDSGTQRWSGTGAVYTPAGQQLSTYKVDVTVAPVDGTPGTFQSIANITKADGSTQSIIEKIIPSSSGSGFQIQSALGNGGGSCYGDDLCEAYIADANGQAFATTIATDADGSRRDLTFQLQNGQAVNVMRDTLKRVN